MKVVIDLTQEKRLVELHNCPDCGRWLQLDGGWQDITTVKAIPRKKNKSFCLTCKKEITVILAGAWIKRWEKYWGFE